MKGNMMNQNNTISLYFFSKLFTMIALIAAFANAQGGQIGFSSVVTDKSSNGTITNVSSGVIEDSRQNWGTNTWSGYFIQITNTTGSVQVRKIISNTSKTITVSPSFSEIPNINSNFVIRRGYKESTQGLKLKLYLQYNDADRSGGKLDGYSCRIQASDTTAVEFVSVEQGTNLGKAWKPSFYAPPGKGCINWLVLRTSESQPLASGLYNIATVTFNLLKTETSKPITFSVTNCPNGGLPIGSTENSEYLFLDTTSNEAFTGSEELLVLNTKDIENPLAMEHSLSSRTINSYPNPFNPTTTLRYELTEYSEVHLVVFDMLGRLVNELVSSNQYEGLHSISWEPTNVSSGTYFARLTTQGSISKQKDVKTLKLAFTK
jgi:hypothetical protein